MPTKELIREYHFEDAKLSTEASRIENNVKRDKAEFAKRNIGDTDISALQNAITNFDDYPTDEEWMGEITVATDLKDDYANRIRMQVRSIRSMAALQYKSMGKYRTFGFEKMDKLDDNNLYRLSLRVVRLSTKLLPDLTARGLTTEIIMTLANTAKEFFDALEAQAEKMEDRDLAAQERVTLGNTLYAIVMELAWVGKALFEDTDEARYNDYVLYGGGSKERKEPE